MDKFRQSFDIDTTASLGANPRRHRELERSARWNLNADLLVLHQVVFRSFTYSKLLVSKEVVGANGFEPSTSWSRTSASQILNALSGVAYGTESLISPLLVVPNLSLVHTPGSNRNHT